MKLSDYARKCSVCYRTAHNWFQQGFVEGAYQLPSGTIVVPDEISKIEVPEHVVVYARVSSSQNKDNLNSQAQRVSAFCSAKGFIVKEVIKECASGLNDQRPKLQKIFTDRKATKIVVEHKDRLTRFGFEYIKTLFDGEIIVINEAEESETDLMQDFVSLVTSFCARLYGRRGNKRRTIELIENLKNED